ncbi:MAG: DUF3784 domain-containing protein [Ruminococcaceae bacterium]|nr:DUF3784 domain-containing protein [Oscillospiraceae bacterium]
MPLKELIHGPEWILWVLVVLLGLLGILLLSGRGAWLIAGYNTADAEEKSRYDEKKLCRIMGVGMLVLTALLLPMAVSPESLSSWYVWVFLAGTLADCGVLIGLANTVCKK